MEGAGAGGAAEEGPRLGDALAAGAARGRARGRGRAGGAPRGAALGGRGLALEVGVVPLLGVAESSSYSA
jgi:hypothetical protein